MIDSTISAAFAGDHVPSGAVVTAASPTPTTVSASGAAGGGSRTGPWYASDPLPQVQHPNLSLYTFTSKPLEQLVFTHASAAAPTPQPQNLWFSGQPTPPPPASPPQDNHTLQWTGVSVVQSLCSIQLTSLYPALSSAALSDLRSALTTKHFHAHLSRTLGLPPLLKHQAPTPLSDRILAELFEAYVGGIARDLGTEKFGELYKWYFALLQPYVTHYYELYHKLPPPSSNSNTSSASSEAKIRRQTVAAYTSRLMEYAAKNKLEPPKFEFSDNGQQGAAIQWEAIVSLGGTQVARAIATTKLEAKHLASREALGALRAPVVTDPAVIQQNAAERRRKKMERRRVGGPAPPQHHPAPPGAAVGWTPQPHLHPGILMMPGYHQPAPPSLPPPPGAMLDMYPPQQRPPGMM